MEGVCGGVCICGSMPQRWQGLLRASQARQGGGRFCNDRRKQAGRWRVVRARACVCGKKAVGGLGIGCGHMR